MISVVPKERFSSCRLCHGLVASNDPVCKNCGLETNEEAIIIESTKQEIEDAVLSMLYLLKPAAIISLALTILGYFAYLYFADFHVTFVFKAYFFIGGLGFISYFGIWNYMHEQTRYSEEDKKFVEKEKRTALTIFSISLALGAFIYIFLLK